MGITFFWGLRGTGHHEVGTDFVLYLGCLPG